MKGTRARKPLAALKKRPLRIDPGSEDELKALARSWLADPLHDILVRASDLAIGDGNRRVAGLELLGEIDADVFLLEGDVTDRDLDRMAMVSAFHRSPLGGYDQACIVRSMKEAQPGITNKDLAGEMHIDPATVTKYLSLFECIPAVQDAAKAGKLGVTDWYAISRTPDQEEALKLALNGATRADLEREGKRRRNGNGQPTVRMPKIKIPLATDIATGMVTLAGESIDLDDAENLLKEALKAVRAAKDKALNTATAQKVWRDMAQAGA